MFFCFIIIVNVLQITSNEVYKSDSDIADNSDTISHIPQPVSSDQRLEETQTRSSQEEEFTPSISEHIGSNTILLNIIMITDFIAQQQQSKLSKLEKNVTDKQRRDEVRDKWLLLVLSIYLLSTGS